MFAVDPSKSKFVGNPDIAVDVKPISTKPYSGPTFAPPTSQKKEESKPGLFGQPVPATSQKKEETNSTPMFKIDASKNSFGSANSSASAKPIETKPYSGPMFAPPVSVTSTKKEEKAPIEEKSAFNFSKP